MLSLFPRGVLDEIWDVTESVSEVFLPTSVSAISGCAAFNIVTVSSDVTVNRCNVTLKLQPIDFNSECQQLE